MKNNGLYRVPHEFYSEICIDHTPARTFVVEGGQMSMERGMPTKFGYLEKKLVIVPILLFPYWKKEFHVHVDA
jgi:hypothetical protein